jgi:hypothetical protein
MYDTYRPNPRRPKAINIRPASIPAVAASAMLVAYSDTTTAIEIVTNRFGPEIMPRVPPNIAANNPTATAPYRPAAGPRPEITP